MPIASLATPEADRCDVPRQFRVRPCPPPRSRMDVAEHEHPPGPSGDPRRDPAERGRTGVQPLSPEGRRRRSRRRNPTGPRPRGPRPPPDERRYRWRIPRDDSDAGTEEPSPLDGPLLPPDPRPGGNGGGPDGRGRHLSEAVPADAGTGERGDHAANSDAPPDRSEQSARVRRSEERRVGKKGRYGWV